jgi:hypothetical protein
MDHHKVSKENISQFPMSQFALIGCFAGDFNPQRGHERQRVQALSSMIAALAPRF